MRIGTSDVLSVALDEAIAIGRAFTLTVGGEATLQIGDVVMLSATKMTLRAVQELPLEVGSSCGIGFWGGQCLSPGLP